MKTGRLCISQNLCNCKEKSHLIGFRKTGLLQDPTEVYCNWGCLVSCSHYEPSASKAWRIEKVIWIGKKRLATPKSPTFWVSPKIFISHEEPLNESNCCHQHGAPFWSQFLSNSFLQLPCVPHLFMVNFSMWINPCLIIRGWNVRLVLLKIHNNLGVCFLWKSRRKKYIKVDIFEDSWFV